MVENSSFFSLIRFFQNRAKKEKKDDFESFFRTERRRRRGKKNECFVVELFRKFNIEYVMRCYAKKNERTIGRQGGSLADKKRPPLPLGVHS